jgi:hypothetical protein
MRRSPPELGALPPLRTPRQMIDYAKNTAHISCCEDAQIRVRTRLARDPHNRVGVRGLV